MTDGFQLARALRFIKAIAAPNAPREAAKAIPASGDGRGIVGCMATGRWNSRIAHSRSSATFPNSLSGFTAAGFPTTSSIGMSETESD